MTARHLLPRGLVSVLAAASCLVAPAVAAAHSTWKNQTRVSPADVSGGVPHISATADGTVTVVWQEEAGGGTQHLYARTRRAGESAYGGTVQLTDAPVTLDSVKTTTSGGGDTVVAWVNNDSNPDVISTRTREGDTGAWGPVTPLNNPGEGSGEVSLSAQPDGTVTAAWTTNLSGDNVVRIRTRAEDGTWSSPADLSQGNVGGLRPEVRFNASGVGVVAWRATGSGEELRSARFTPESGWAQLPNPIAVGSGSLENLDVAVSDDGDAVAVWAQSESMHGQAAWSRLAQDDDAWSPPQPLETGSDESTMTSVQYDPDGMFVVTWQAYTWDADPYAAYSSSYNQIRTLDEATGAWSPATYIGGSRRSGAPLLVGNEAGDMIAYMIGADENFAVPHVLAAFKRAGSRTFSSVQDVSGDDFNPWLGGLPDGTIDGRGNGYAAYPIESGPTISVHVNSGDFALPRLDDVFVPESGVTGRPLTVSVNPFDRESGIAGTNWDFGDGSTRSGASVSHTYGAAGTYDVTVTTTDAAGNQTTATRTVVISDPPPETPAAKAPLTLAPKSDPIPARLQGRVITITSPVTLRRGRCVGTATATTLFGSRSYRTTVKLKTATLPVSGKVCLASGTIRLKRTPSTRTRLRVTLSSKSIKTRTLTTRRA